MSEMVPEGQGRLRIITVDDPVMGANWKYDQPESTRWWLQAVAMIMVTDGNVAERFPVLSFKRGVDIVLEIPLQDSIDANLVKSIEWYPGAISITGTDGDMMPGALPHRLLFNNEIQLTMRTLNMQAGDQYQQIYLWVEEWIEPLA